MLTVKKMSATGGARGFFSKIFGRGMSSAVPKGNVYVFMDVSQDDQNIGTMEFLLYNQSCPKT